GAMAASPTGVKTHLLLGQAAERVVEDVDRESEVAAQVFPVPIGIERPCRAELGLIDLDDEAGVGYRLVLLPAGVRDRHHVFVFRLVVQIVDAGAKTERAEGSDIALDTFALQRGFEVCNVLGNSPLSLVAFG